MYYWVHRIFHALLLWYDHYSTIVWNPSSISMLIFPSLKTYSTRVNICHRSITLWKEYSFRAPLRARDATTHNYMYKTKLLLSLGYKPTSKMFPISQPNTSRPLRCVFCFRRFKYDQSLQTHLLADHSSTISALNHLRNYSKAASEVEACQFAPRRVSVIKKLENYLPWISLLLPAISEIKPQCH